MSARPLRIVLGSASPRRRELLERVGVDVEVVPVDIDEAHRPGEASKEYIERVVTAKLEACRGTVGDQVPVLVADTIVVLDDRILGKPTDDGHATEMLSSLAGRHHVVATRFALAKGARLTEVTVETLVEFRPLDGGEIADYVATGEGRDKAGSYAIQGKGAVFVRRIEGSYTNVVGLPIAEVYEELRRFDRA